ncbi:MAG: S1/P1 Nuclease [Bacteroidetes bacterium]|nr:S1/P1 Nuclease [Bacteroidota bacterium]
MIGKLLPSVLVLSFTLFPQYLWCWGFFGHRTINRVAVFTLPKPLFAFYKYYLDYVTEHAVDADKRRYASEEEAPRHYIDIDHYGKEPFAAMPQSWDSAVAKYGEDTLMAYGIVPWQVQRVYRGLVHAFYHQDRDKILWLSADLGHYVADAHVPLHTTVNYNGQLTGQDGIHGFWESRLPELFAVEYDFFLPRAAFIRDPLSRIWKVVYDSHMALDSVLELERQLTETTPQGDKYAVEERGVTLTKTYSQAFSAAYHVALNGMVERRMRQSIRCVGSLWYSAWIEAGQPKLDHLVDEEVGKGYLRQIEEELKTWKKGNWIGRPEGEEE